MGGQGAEPASLRRPSQGRRTSGVGAPRHNSFVGRFGAGGADGGGGMDPVAMAQLDKLTLDMDRLGRTVAAIATHLKIELDGAE